MIDKKNYGTGEIFNELDDANSAYWFDFKKSKFLHNIDTFYYSVKLYNDLTAKTSDPAVLRMRKRFQQLKDKMGYNDSILFYLKSIGKNMNLLSYGYGKYYSICLECPEYFDIFLAEKVPPAAEGKESVTCEIIVQIRSYMLWMYGVYAAFEHSFEYVKALCDEFGLNIAFAQENRIDYCWHSNYLTNPEKYFAIDNFYKMRVDRYRGANYHTAKVGSEDYEIDYVSLGQRGGKCFVRIYLKSKEVVEQGYKAFFFKVWLFNGLISRYDLYCYEAAYLRRSWKYVTIARLQFYLEHGTNDFLKEICSKYIAEYNLSNQVTDNMIQLADQLTPKIHLVMNVEFQTMRKSSKSYTLLPISDNSCRGPAKRIYDYLDNRPLIVDYLTHETLRLVDPSGDTNKSRRPYNGFWKALRSCKYIDMKKFPDYIRLVRTYHRKLNAELLKAGLINKAVVYGIYTKGVNDDEVMKDCMEALLKMNDNDLIKAKRYKEKKIRQFSGAELADPIENLVDHDFVLYDRTSDCIYDDDTIHAIINQEEGADKNE
jgi:hypothetical protein